MVDNIFKGAPFGGRVPLGGAPGQSFPVVNGGAPRAQTGQVPMAQGFMPMAPAPTMPPVPGGAPKASPVPAPPRPRQAAPQTPGAVPSGSKADCPVCRSFGRR